MTPKCSHSLLRSALITLLAFAAPLRVFGGDYFTLVPNGKFVAVGRVVIGEIENDNLQGKPYGTGTLIAPDLVLTAAHVIQTSPTPRNIVFAVTKHDGGISLHRVLAYRTHPQYFNREAPWAAEENGVIDLDMTTIQASDLAILRLAEPIKEKIVFPSLGKLPSKPGTNVEAVGFGQIEGPTGATEMKRSGVLEFLETSSQVAIFRTPPGGRQRTNHGDSGGPLLLVEEGKETIVALTKGYMLYDKIKGLDPTSYGLYAPIESNLKWIEAAIEELKQIDVQDGSYFYLKRRTNQPTAQLAMTVEQITGLQDVETPEVQVASRFVARGINEPIPEKVAKHFSERYTLVLPEHFVPLNPARTPPVQSKVKP